MSGEKAPKVSVVLPVYNVEPYIGRCIESLRAQTLGDIELIFVDDCGTDGSMAAVEAWAARDSRVRILRNEENLGQGPSRNRGIEAARGDYLAFFDPDDYATPDFFELLYAAATSGGGHDIAKGLRCLVDAKTGEVSPPSAWLNETIRAHLAEGKPLYTTFTYEQTTAIFRRSLFDTSVRYGATRNSEDITFLLRCCYQTEDLVFQESAIYFYVQREGSVVHGDAAGIANGQVDALVERLEFLRDKGLDDEAIRYLLARSNDCLVRLHDAIGEGRARKEDHDRITARIAEIVRPLPGALEASEAWPRVQEALNGSRREGDRNSAERSSEADCGRYNEPHPPARPWQVKAVWSKRPPGFARRIVHRLMAFLRH